jgi:aminomethyltransferase
MSDDLSPGPFAVGDLQRTPLYDLHVELGARMVPFAGFAMPVQYADGTIAEHRHCRQQAALFDVSHMGIVDLHGDAAAAGLEGLVPAAVTTLAAGRQRYTFLTNEQGGIVDDLMVAHIDGRLGLVVNASRRSTDLAVLQAGLEPGVSVELRSDVALLALQGPSSFEVLARHAATIAGLSFMDVAAAAVAGVPCTVSRSGYTGEDGFEIAVPADGAVAVARLLLAEPEVAPAGLGARDTLRIEAGLCLYGNDLDETTTPVEAGLEWAIQRRRREEGGFPGADIVQRQLRDGPERLRVGLVVTGRRPVRAGSRLARPDGVAAGVVTSGGFGPTVGGPVAMGYVDAELARPGTELRADVRGHEVVCTVAELPFTPHRYVRGTDR